MNLIENTAMRLLIERLKNCAAAYTSYAENFEELKATELRENAKRLLTAAECLKMNLLEEELVRKPRVREFTKTSHVCLSPASNRK